MRDRRPFDERVGHALGSGDLTADARRVTDTDLIAAFALTASKVGAACWRMKYGQDLGHVQVRVVVARIARSLAGPFRRASPMVTLVAAEGLYEWLNDTCRTCRGRGWVGFEAYQGGHYEKTGAHSTKLLAGEARGAAEGARTQREKNRVQQVQSPERPDSTKILPRLPCGVPEEAQAETLAASSCREDESKREGLRKHVPETGEAGQSAMRGVREHSGGEASRGLLPPAGGQVAVPSVSPRAARGPSRAALKSCSVCNGTGSLRRTEMERIAALNAAVADWNAQHQPLIRALTLPMRGSMELERDTRRWVNRIDDAVGFIRTHTDCRAAMRAKLG